MKFVLSDRTAEALLLVTENDHREEPPIRRGGNDIPEIDAEILAQLHGPFLGICGSGVGTFANNISKEPHFVSPIRNERALIIG